MRFISRSTIVLTAAAVLFGGCAHLPDATVQYYLPMSQVSFKVTQVVACDAGDNPIVSTAAIPTLKHVADRSTAYPIRTAWMRGGLSDADIKVELYEDGRLSAVNATSTGGGETALKAAITLAQTAAATVKGLALTPSTVCQQITKFGGGKPLVLTYEGTIDLAAAADLPQPLTADTSSRYYAEEIGVAALGGVCAFVRDHGTSVAPIVSTETGDHLLTARQPGQATIEITAGTTMVGPAGAQKQCGGTRVWKDDVTAAQFGAAYKMPFVKPATFGKLTVAASFAESGALKSIQYVTSNGSAQALNVANSALTAIAGQTAAQRAAEVKGEADLIAQQQRLVICKADPTNCK